jgi:hypothetical protein
MLDVIPLWALFLLTSGIVFLAIEGGFRWGSVSVHKDKDDHKSNVGEMVSATLGLVAFILAFTFGMAAERFNDRRSLVIEEANAIGTTYLRADFLPEPHRAEVQNLFRRYVELRIQEPDLMHLAERIAESEKIQDKLWAQTVAFAKANNSPVASTFIQTMNETIDLQAKRVAAAQYARLPNTIWGSLYVMILLGMTAMGYQSGLLGSRNWMVSSFLVLSFALVITIIADLDRPYEGFIMANKMPLIDLAKKIGPPIVDQQEHPTH